METKSPKQLYKKLFFIYTAILVCAISALVIYFFNSTRLQNTQGTGRATEGRIMKNLRGVLRMADCLTLMYWKMNRLTSGQPSRNSIPRPWKRRPLALILT